MIIQESLTWGEFQERGKDLALWVLETRKIPEGLLKEVELACRLYFGRTNRPSNLQLWLDSNKERLSLLESAQRWPEKEKGYLMFDLGPFTVHNVAQHKSLSQITEALGNMTKTLISHPKFVKVLYGDIFLLGKIQKKHAGWYNTETDKVYVFKQRKDIPSFLDDLSHELGHRYWFRHMAESTRNIWAERYKQLYKVTLPPEGQPLGMPFYGLSEPIVEAYMGDLIQIKGLDWFHLRDVENLKCASQFPTAFASYSTEEFFAESFSQYVVGGLSGEHRDFFEGAT